MLLTSNCFLLVLCRDTNFGVLIHWFVLNITCYQPCAKKQYQLILKKAQIITLNSDCDRGIVRCGIEWFHVPFIQSDYTRRCS